MPLGPAIRTGLSELKATFAEARRRFGIVRFLVARMIYQDGVNALLALGGAFAAKMFGWTVTEFGIYGIILNVVAIFGCFAASRLDTALGSKWVVIASLVVLALATVGMVPTLHMLTTLVVPMTPELVQRRTAMALVCLVLLGILFATRQLLVVRNAQAAEAERSRELERARPGKRHRERPRGDVERGSLGSRAVPSTFRCAWNHDAALFAL